MKRCRLSDVRAKMVRCNNWREWMSADGGLLPSQEATLDSYFSQFAASPDGNCIGCGAHQGGDGIDFLMGRCAFRWGIAHGEGYCSECGYPGRAYHRNVGPIKFLNRVLQYHPGQLATKEQP